MNISSVDIEQMSNFLKSYETENKYHYKSICQIFEEQAKKLPNQIAIEFNNITLSYQELDERTNQLAYFIKEQYYSATGEELKHDTLIPISIGRSADYVIGILGILKAGAAYVPINPDYPDSRIEFILSDIKCNIILTESSLSQKYNKSHASLKQILLDEKKYFYKPKSPISLQVTAQDLAYVIYTSGSTGAPKGVLAEHINVISQVVCANYFSANETDCITFFSDVSFDSTTFEIWGALLNGAKLFIPDNLLDLLSKPILFKKTISEKEITIVLLTRALFDLLYSLDETVFDSLKFLLVGGEALTKNIMLKLLLSKYKPKHIINAYGPTENSTFCTTNELSVDFSMFNSVPIGRPYSNRIGFVLDRHLQLVPIGMVGEIYVGGPSLSRGYLNRAELTEERFIPNPFVEENPERYQRIYKTGDLVKWLSNGNLEYLSRNDFQVKLRGYRIELPEIESKILEYPGIRHSVVLLKKNHSIDYLVGYYVAEQPIEDGLLRNYLAKTLPNNMIPSVFQYLETLPVTTNGKLDRNALPEPRTQPSMMGELPQFKNNVKQDAFCQSSDNNINSDLFPIEEEIFAIWSSVLNINEFSKEDSFFNLGGNSISAMMARNKLENKFNININIVELFHYPTIKQLAERLSLLMNPRKQFVSTGNQTASKAIDLSSMENESTYHEPIAVVGMACRLPGANDCNDFWQLLIEEKSNLCTFSNKETQGNDKFVNRGAILEDRFYFDAAFFGYSDKEAEMMDPQQRHFLECSWEALELSGNVPQKFSGDVGVFASIGRGYYFMNNVYSHQSKMSETEIFQTILNNEKDFLSTRVSYKLNLTGPSITLQTACSSSLVSIQMAAESLKIGSSDMALAGGVSIFYDYGYPYQEDMIESPDGYCRAFDVKANGTVVTSGVGVVVLKRLKDAIQQRDTIYAVLKGGAINNDGSSKVGFTAPSVKGQMFVIEKALKAARISPEKISYIEAHGTGTKLGDPIEWTALHNVYKKYTNEKEFCTIGSVKTNIGHTDAAAGVMGFIKTVLALKNQMLPATLNFETLNSEIAAFNSLFRVSNKTMPWECSGKTRFAAVSSFGLGGTNAHVILEEYNNKNDQSLESIQNEKNQELYYLIPFSAKNKESLNIMAIQLKQKCQTIQKNELQGISYTAQLGRAEFNERGYLLCNDEFGQDKKIISYLRNSTYQEEPSIIFNLSSLSPLAGKQFNELCQKVPILKDYFAACATILLEKHDINIKSMQYSNQSLNNKFLDFSIQYAMSKLLNLFNIVPDGYLAKNENLVIASVLADDLSLEEAFSFIKSFNEDSKWSQPLKSIRKGKRQIILTFGDSPLEDEENFIHPIFFNETIVFKNATSLLLKIIGWLWCHGCPINWDNIWEQIIQPKKLPKKIMMPTYCFTKKKYEMQTFIEESQLAKGNELTEEILKEMWTKVLGIPEKDISDTSNFFDLGGDSLSLIDLSNLLKKSFLPALNLNEIVDHIEFDKMLHFCLKHSFEQSIS